jgi:D-glycero-D-manno-heptose 1,7-bisphosphate phosphatase
VGIRTLREKQAVFFDRDGVLNEAIVREGKPYPPGNLSEVRLVEGAVEGCRLLRSAGYLLIGVTNQPDVARGVTRKEVVEEINNHIRARMGLDEVRVCYHDDVDGCACRKPSPGLLLEASKDWGIDLGHSFMVGDRWKDVQAGVRAGCRTVFLDRGYDERLRDTPDATVSSFEDAVSWILGRRGK